MSAADESSAFERAILAHDRAMRAQAPAVWVGAEPTFTLKESEAPEWLREALGGEKERAAHRIVAQLQTLHPGAVVLRSLGRQYAGEAAPRWSIGLYFRRDGESVWKGPPDPLLRPVEVDAGCLIRLRDRLVDRLASVGWEARPFAVAEEPGLRVVARRDGGPLVTDVDAERRLARTSVHRRAIPTGGLQDDLAAEGLYLAAVGTLSEGPGTGSPCIELPMLPSVEDFLVWLDAIARAASEAEVPALAIRGFPPPVDARVAWTTVTPDPAVIEVNQAPFPDSESFYNAIRELYAVAEGVGLSPYRLQYNGNVSDSGGGGQFTLGGPAPESSPFFVVPMLLPRLIRYLSRHPSLSYLFAPDYVGGSSQSPRPDEGVREAFLELELALDQLEKNGSPGPELLWRSLRHFLVDPSGNAHRSELNIEKLWNSSLPGRGCLGLVELRAFRMPPTPERNAAIGAMLRGVAGLLCSRDVVPDLTYWGDVLHDRFALPFYLLRDLQEVFSDLENGGLGLGSAVRDVLTEDMERPRWSAQLANCKLEIEKAVEFWPLLGDVASQERGGSRLVDASTLRLQLLLHNVEDGALPLDEWQLFASRHLLPLRSEKGPWGGARLIGVRYRDFVPWNGLHPELSAQGVLRFALSHPALEQAMVVSLYNWKPDATSYPGLPADLAEARHRREERLVVEHVPRDSLLPLTLPPESALSEYSVDLRRF